MLDLNTRVDLNEVVPAHLVDQELCGTSVAIADALRKLDRVAEDRLADLFGEVRRGRDLNDLLVAALHGAVALKEVDRVPLGVREELDLNVARPLKEALDEDGAVAERGLGLAHGALERALEVGHLAHDTHAATTTAHRGLDDHWSRSLGLNSS